MNSAVCQSATGEGQASGGVGPFGPILAAIKKDPGPIPELKPPRGQIPFDLPEHLVFDGALVLAVIALIVGRLVQRRRPPLVPQPEPPIEVARRELAVVGEEGALAACTQVVRRYVGSAFGLGAAALSTEELCAAFLAHPAADTDSLGALREFLSVSDLARFAPASEPISAKDAVCRAFVVIELLEARLVSSSPPPLPASA